MASSRQQTRTLVVASAIFFVIGPGLEAGVGPALLTGGFERSDGLPDSVVLTVLGWMVIVAGLAVLVATYAGFARDGFGTPSPMAPPRELVVTGAYRYVRNPMYVATAAVIVGEGLVLRQPILLVAAVVYCAALGALAHFREEPLLSARFGPSYAAYRDAVPGWVPRLRRYRG